MALDGSHFYLRDGTPFYEITGKNGKLRAVTLRDVRIQQALPSVTTVLKIIAKPQLEAWKVKQGILAALTLARNEGEPDDAYLGRVLADSREQAKQAAEEGSRIHDANERGFTGRPILAQYMPHVQAVRAELARLFPAVHDWQAERAFGSPLGFGGRVDLHSPSTGIVVDYKGKDGDFSDGARLAYDQHYQLGAYQEGLALPRAEGCNIFVSRTHPGKVASHIWTREDMEYGANVFKRALALWTILNKYDPTSAEGTEHAKAK